MKSLSCYKPEEAITGGFTNATQEDCSNLPRISAAWSLAEHPHLFRLSDDEATDDLPPTGISPAITNNDNEQDVDKETMCI